MDMWSNNLKQNLEEAAKEKRINDYLVSLSASLSMKYVIIRTMQRIKLKSLEN